MLRSRGPSMRERRWLNLRVGAGRDGYSRVTPYLVAIAATMLAGLLRWAADPIWDASAQYLLYYFSVMLVAVVGGFWPGLLAAALGAVAGAWFFYVAGHVGESAADDALRLFMFLAFAVAATFLAGRLHAARDQAVSHAASLVESLHRLGKAQEALSESEQRLRATFENAASGIMEMDSKDCFAAVNDRICDMLGYAREELLGMCVHDLSCPEDRPRSNDLYAQLHDGRLPVLQYEQRYLKRDGSLLWVNIGVSAVRDAAGRFLYSVGTVVDISARKAAEAQVRLQAAALEAAPSAISLSETDPEGTIVWVNPAFTKLTGYSAEEAVGQTHHMLSSGQQNESFYRELWETISRGGVWRGELVNRRKDGTLYHEEMGITPMRDEDGKITHYMAIKQDITARRQAEEALRESEERFRAVCDNARAAFGILVGTRLIYANRYFSEMTGYSIEEILSMDFRQMTHPSFHQLMVDRARKRLAGEPVPSHYEFLAVTKSGEERWIDFSPAAATLHGQPVIIGTGFDVTERKRAESALKESEEKFRLLAENSRVFICIFQDRRVLYANPYLVEISGYTREEIRSLDFADLIPPEDRAAALIRASRRQHGEPPSTPFELRLIDKSGEVHWVEFSGVQIQYHGSAAVLAAGIDITRRKRTEEALRRSESFYRQSLESIPGMVFTTRPDGYCDYQSQQWVDYTGVPMGDHLGDGWNKLLHPEDRPRAFAAWRAAVEGRASYDLEYRVRRHDGEYEWFKVAGRPIRDENGQIVRWFGIATNIENLKRAEQELAAAKETAEQASRAKDHFMAVLSHELRTPLTPVLATVSALQEDAGLSEGTRDSLEMVRRNVELEARLIDDLLDVTRIARGKVQLDKRPVRLCTVIGRAVEVCKADIEARRLHFNLDLGPAAPYWVEADIARLQQVFWNLIKNAIKFTPHGGFVGIRCSPSGNGSEARVLAEVSDNGEGIEREVLASIFNAFEQARNVANRQFGGLGLGLAISKALVEMHGGTIEAHSDGKGRGAIFRVTLPLVAPAGVAMPERRQEAVEREVPALRILFVEDHGDTARVMKRLLERRGHEVQTAGDVATAVEMAERQRFDLLISDLGLPDGSGLDLMRRLRERGRDLKGIALSGYGMEVDVKRSREAGFIAHLTKPVRLAMLNETIAQVVERGGT